MMFPYQLQCRPDLPCCPAGHLVTRERTLLTTEIVFYAVQAA